MRTEGLSINLATVREQWNLREAVEACAKRGVRAVAPWREQVAAIGLDESARVIKGHGMQVTSYCRGGFFPAPDASGRQQAIDDNKKAIDEAAAIGADCLVLVVGGLPEGSRDIAGARAMGLPRGTWWRATLALFVLQQASRLLTSAELNVNLAHGPYRGWEATFSGYAAYWAFMLSGVTAGFFAIEVAVRRLLPRAEAA